MLSNLLLAPPPVILGPYSMTMITMVSADERTTSGSASGTKQDNHSSK